MKYYEAVKERKAGICDRTDIMLNEISQAQKGECHKLSVIHGT